MSNILFNTRTTALVLLIAISFVAGWLVPGFYEWTDSDQSRPSPLLWQVPVGIAIASVIFCVILPWLPIRPFIFPEEPRTVFSFGLRSLVIVTTLIAIGVAVGIRFPLVVCGIVCLAAFVYLSVSVIRNPPYRLPLIALLACMYMPYVWVANYDELGRILQALPILLPSMPTFVPGAWLGIAFGQHFRDSQWVAYLLTAIELVAGVWIIRLGPKPTIAFLLLVMQVSLFGSLLFLQLCLA